MDGGLTQNVLPFRISVDGSVPIYLQIVRQVKGFVKSGELKPGNELPTIRALAETLEVNPNTVARAYRELEMEGVVITGGAKGTRLSQGADSLEARQRRLNRLEGTMEAVLKQARELNLSKEEIIRLVARFYDADEAHGGEG